MADGSIKKSDPREAIGGSDVEEWLQELVRQCRRSSKDAPGTGWRWAKWLFTAFGQDPTPESDASPKFDEQEETEAELLPCHPLAPSTPSVGPPDWENGCYCSFLLQGRELRTRCAADLLDLSLAEKVTGKCAGFSSGKLLCDLISAGQKTCDCCKDPLGWHRASYVRGSRRVVLRFEEYGAPTLRCQDCSAKWQLPVDMHRSMTAALFFSLLWYGQMPLPCGCSFERGEWLIGDAVFVAVAARTTTLELRGPCLRPRVPQAPMTAKFSAGILAAVSAADKLLQKQLTDVFAEFRRAEHVPRKSNWLWSFVSDDDEAGLKCALRSRNLLEASALLRQCAVRLRAGSLSARETEPGGDDRLLQLGAACQLYTCLTKCHRLASGIEQQGAKAPSNLLSRVPSADLISPASPKSPAASRAKLATEISSPAPGFDPPRRSQGTRKNWKHKTIGPLGHEQSHQRSGSVPPRTRLQVHRRAVLVMPPENEGGMRRRGSLDDMSLGPLLHTALPPMWEASRPLALDRRASLPPQRLTHALTESLELQSSESSPSLTRASKSDLDADSEWNKLFEEPRTLLEEAGISAAAYNLGVPAGLCGTGVPLPFTFEVDDVGAIIAHALLSTSLWDQLRERLMPFCLCSNPESTQEGHCLKSLRSSPEEWESFDFGSIGSDNSIQVVVQASEGDAWCVTVAHPLRFHLLRHLAFGDDAVFCGMLRRCVPHDTSGGKSKASFWRSAGGELALKEVRRSEAQRLGGTMGGPLASRLAAALKGGEPSLICEVFGLFEVKPIRGRMRQETRAIIVMRNMLYGSDDWQLFDLKGVGSQRCESTLAPRGEKPEQESKQVRWDAGFLRATAGFPLVLEPLDKEALEQALLRDLQVLQELELVDYSLLLAKQRDGNDRVRLAIIDFLQPYTFNKQLESAVKKLVQRNEPTIVEPVQYARRFSEFIRSAFECAIPAHRAFCSPDDRVP
eukprot:TRINITY_DN40398_c0_g1_i1.p1 TRINITY_DN40398_c0_g1~~TRINITY_DN40398_c0_g1_i1.p1  ORF type:complete len:965 (+),score=167.32 TRINITY_DN40398_c0_g1_i1:29-2923(+)